MTRMVHLLLFLVAIFIFASTSQAQISITSSDLLALIGTSQSVESDTSGGITVNVGSAGTNQTWDFRSLTIDGVNAAFDFIGPTGTPFEGDFPTANFVQRLEFDAQTSLYTYSEVTSDAFSQLGIGTVSTNPDTSFIMERSDDVAPLPLTFGTMWTSTTTDTTDFGSGVLFVNNSTTTNNVDGWGTVRLPVGDFDCLRIREDSEHISETIFNGNVQTSDTTRDISYTWVSKQNFLLVAVTSQDGETDPNFTEASSVFRITDMGTAVNEPSEQIPESPALLQNYPNPFNPETVIRFELSTRGPIDLTVYNLLGQEVRTLVNEVRSSGPHHVRWNGLDDDGREVAGGVYLYRLKTGTSVETRKMVLLR